MPAARPDAATNATSVDGAHAGNLANALPQVVVERGGARLRISGLRRVQLEQQQVVAIEAERNRLQVGQRAHEQPGANEQQHQQRDLRRRPALRGRAVAREARLDVLQRRHQRRPRRLNRRREAEEHAAQHRQRDRDGEHAPVQTRRRACRPSSLLASSRRQHAGSRDRDQHAERAADHATARGFPSAAGESTGTGPRRCSSRTAISRWRAVARASSRLAVFAHAIARIRPTIASRTVQRLRVPPPQRIETAAAIIDAQHRKVGALDVVCRGRRHPLRERRRQRRFRLLARHAVSQAAHDPCPVPVRIARTLAVRRSSSRMRLHRQIDVRS